MKMVFFVFGLFLPLVASQDPIAGFKKADLKELLKLCDLQAPDTNLLLIETIEKEWLDLPEESIQKKYESKREQFLQIFKRMWLVDEWINQRFGYAHLVCMPPLSVLKSNDFVSALIKLKRTYVTYNSCVFFAVDRPLTAEEKVHAKGLGLSDAKVEGQVYEWLLYQQKIDAEMLKRVIVRGVLDKRGKYIAPSPKQMITAWYASIPKPQPGFVLVVAQQPWCYYYQLCLSLLCLKRIRYVLLELQRLSTHLLVCIFK